MFFKPTLEDWEVETRWRFYQFEPTGRVSHNKNELIVASGRRGGGMIPILEEPNLAQGVFVNTYGVRMEIKGKESKNKKE